MANNFYGATGLIGGAAGALDLIDGAGLADLDAAFVSIAGKIYVYVLDADSAVAESSPEVISPDTNAGDKRWVLQTLGLGAGAIGDNAHSLSFGSGNVGIYEKTGDLLKIAVNGGDIWEMSNAKFGGADPLRPYLRNTATSATNPNVLTNASDINSGIGQNAADELSMISGGVEGIRVTEVGGVTAAKAFDSLDLSNTAEGKAGSIGEKTTREVHTLTLGATSVTTTITIPTGAMLLGVSFNVNDTVTDTAGDDTWSAAFSGGSTATLATAAAAAIDTKVNTLIVPEIASGATEITFTPNGGNFGGGIIEIVAYYKSLTSLGDV